MRLITRDKSVITGQANLKSLYTFKNFPVFFGCIKHNIRKDLYADMSWAICPRTGVIQLTKLIPLNILYQAQHVDATGPTWAKYYQDLARYIKRQKIQKVLEIGGGSGDLAKIFVKASQKTHWTIIEPNPLIKTQKRIRVISGFFDEKFKLKEKVDGVVFSQVLEHSYDPPAFVKNIASFLEPGNKLIFAYPNLKLWLKRKYTNAINFEHTIFLTDYWVDYLLKKYGFKILDKTRYQDHSFFYTVQKLNQPSSLIKLPQSRYQEYKKIFEGFIGYHHNLVKKLNQQIGRFSGEIYLFGAHIFSQYLLEFGLNKKRIKALLDNSPLKQGKRLYGTPFRVYPPSIIKNKKNVAVVLKVGIYRDEILKQLKKINPRVKIFE